MPGGWDTTPAPRKEAEIGIYGCSRAESKGIPASFQLGTDTPSSWPGPQKPPRGNFYTCRNPLRITEAVIGRRFHLTYTIRGVRKLLVRNGWSCRVPARRAVERDDDAVAGWVEEVWRCAEDSRRPVETGSSSGHVPCSGVTAAG
ncbi:winged helix-turn-helix domain-containing protein [Streptomyces sp. ICN441]|uniref:helix-turn-helix domain-containing protein n=1 Tax=Streptomyces sp. ICN441 TaxID=2558286 RepID=UPI00320AACD7